jgi:cob(I)alamin adenosyltransferase
LECYGTIDELNAFTGKLKFLCANSEKQSLQKITEYLHNVQKTLFDIGAVLANPNALEWANKTKELEEEIDRMNAELEPLKNFTIPGENAINAEAHICRTVCRRAERILHAAKENGIAVCDSIASYINRLSDYFFVLSRYALL